MIRFITLLCLLLLSSMSLAQSSPSPTVIKVGYPSFDWAPFSYVSAKGHVSGLLPSLVHEIALNGHFKTETRVYPTFSDVLHAFEKNEIDILVGVSSTYERQKIMAFSQPLLSIPMAAITHAPPISSIHQLNNKLIALEHGFAIGEQLQHLSAQTSQIVAFPTSEQALTAVQHGTTDAYIGNAIALDEIRNHANGHPPLLLNILHDVPYERLYIAAHKQQGALIARINHAISKVSQSDMNQLYNTWLSSSQRDMLSHQSVLNLTEEEVQWLAQHNTLKVAYHPNDYPYQFKDNDGLMAGMSADLLRLLAQQLDITLVTLPINNLDSIMADLNSGKIDAVAAVTCTPERLNKLNCTQPYSEEKWVMLSAVTQKKNYVDNHSHIGAVSGRFGEVLLKQLYPNNPVTLFNSNAALLRATLSHQVDMAVISLSSASQLLQGEYLGKLRVQISKLDSEGRPVGIAVAHNNTILHDILNKTMAATEPSKLADIKNAWHTVTLNSGVSISKLVFWGFAGFGLIALLTLTFLYWTQKLNNEIAQRKDAEQKLTYLTNNFDGILLQHRQRSLDPTDIELLFVSEKIIDLIGISADELRARPQRIIELLQQRNDNVWLFGEINHALKQGYWQTELQLQSVNDHDRWVEIRSQVVPVEQGWQWTSILIDISNMKKQQFELEHAREEAESATEAKSRFLAMMSHEIRTPISGISSLLELMAPYTRDHAELSGIHKHLDQSANNLLNIVNDVLDFSKIEAGKLTLSPAPCVMTDMLHTLMQPHVIHAKQKGLCFRFWQDPQLAEQLWVDELRLKQVLNNLLNNATKFTEHGTISLLVDVLATQDNHQQLRFTVSDTGIGISEADGAKLFQPFQQVDARTERRFSGTGLGLSICRQIVQLMGGEISMTSSPNNGAMFSFTLQAECVKPRATHTLGLQCGLVDTPLHEDIALPHYLTDWACQTIYLQPLNASSLLEEARLLALDVILVTARWCQQMRFTAEDAAALAPTRVITLTTDAMLTPEVSQHGWTLSYSPLQPQHLLHALQTDTADWTFTPLDTEQAQVVPVSRAEAMARQQLILVAEDHPINQQIIRQQLQRLGYYADIVDNGRLALDALAQQHYALLLTDCHMPELDGYGLIKALRARGDTLPVIALTANIAQSADEHRERHGFNDFLSKPVSLPTLAATLAQWMPAAHDVSMTGDTYAISEAASIHESFAIHENFAIHEGLDTHKSTRIDEASHIDEPSRAANHLFEDAAHHAESITLAAPSAENTTLPQGPIDLSLLLAIFGDESICLDFMQQYLTTCETDFQALSHAMTSNDIADVQHIGHRMKGAALMMECQAIATLCEQIEESALNGHIEHALLSPIEALIHALHDQVGQPS